MGYEHVQPLEKLWIWNLNTKKILQQETLDLDDNIDHTEDPSKLFVFGSENHILYVRSDNKRGVKLISLQDDVKIGETKQIHSNPILQIKPFAFKKQLLTCGKDRKIKVYDLISEEVVTTLPGKKNIESIELSTDQNYLFSSDHESFVSIWYTENWILLCKI